MSKKVKDLSFEFAVQIVKFCNKLFKESRDNYPVIQQLLKSGTSIGANIEEANAAQSKKDFLAKMYISFKEARETNYWLRLIKESEITKSRETDELIKISLSLIKMLSSITYTTKKNLSSSN
ncbi:MAG: four helix bundle protein [Candidatus Cloacimonetes bacterium]|nr:four helix bundle protein [Candidatus Cloacimonadota bacterium]